MKKYLWMVIIVAALIGMCINIDWSKDAVKAFISGGVIVWMTEKLWSV